MANSAPQKYKVLKWVLGVLGIIAVILICASWYISYKIKPIIKQELTSLVNKATHGLYHIEFTDLNTNLLTGSATFSELKLLPDTVAYRSLVAEEKAPNNLFYIELKKLSIKNFHPFDFFFNKKAEIDLLLFDKPKVTMVNKHFDFNDDRPPRPRKSPYDYIAKLFKSLRVELIDFKNVSFVYVNNNGAIPHVDSVSNLNVTLNDWLIDSLSAQDTTRLYLLKNVSLNLVNYKYATPDSMYYLTVNQLDFNAIEKKVNIKQFGLVPRYSEADFARVAGYARDRFSIQLNNVSLSNIDLPAYLQKQEVIAEDMQVADGHVAVFNDGNFPKLKKDKTGKFPHQLLQQLEAQLTINKILLSNIDVTYTELNDQSKLRGKLAFRHTSGLITNVTNSAKAKAKNGIMTADLKSDVMGQGALTVNFRFDLQSPYGAFDYKGNIRNLDMRRLNAVIKPLGFLQVNKGIMRDLAFDVKATQDVAKGRIKFKYNDLSVALLKKEEGRARLRKKGLLSILANASIIYSDNPSVDGKFTVAKVNFARERTASFFSYIWKTLFQGVKFSVGITPQKEAEIRQQIKKFEQMKDDRDERRKRRQLRIDQREKERLGR